MGIQQLKSSKILVIGDSCIDRYHFGISERLSGEAPVPIFKLSYTEEKSGMAGNVYQNLINLGNEVELITNDEVITKERFVDEISKQHLMRLDTGEAFRISSFIKSGKTVEFENYDCVVFSDYDKGFLDIESIEHIFNILEGKDIPIFVDSKKRDLSLYKNCFIKINENEHKNLKREPENSNLIVTLGKKGVKYNNVVYDAFLSDVDNTNLPPNVCGAGDTFLAGLVTQYMLNKDITDAIYFANFCASIAVKNFGTYVIKEDDIKIWK